MRSLVHITITLTAAALAFMVWEARADACGCLSPPAPVDNEEFAVNQQAEQIIFEVEDEHVVAHVLIKYAGKPESFAWVIPVPSVPELALSSTAAFGLLDTVTRPLVSVGVDNQCPESEYYCQYHPAPECPAADDNPFPGFVDAGAGSSADAAPSPTGPPPVDVLDRQTVGSYETIVFSAGDTAAAVAWLNQEGFIVNQTMAPFMQPYADMGMLFLASKLVAGADVSEIRPLRLRYPGQTPMIPLKLTAVAAEPHMTITAYIYGDRYYRPEGRPLVDIDTDQISRDGARRVNYPMVLARTIDEAGGDGFVAEYVGGPQVPDFEDGSGCCTAGFDLCQVEYDGVCSCPNADFDATDCEREAPELLEGLALLNQLRADHPKLTRLTTRISPEEMTFDPVFMPMPAGAAATGRLSLSNRVKSLEACEDDILEPELYEAILERQDCSAVYCGTGECVTTDRGAGCSCLPGSVARTFVDLDGERSITCVPEQAMVDLSAGGLELPDACAGISCGGGACVEVGGFPTCRCELGNAAVLTANPLVPTCRQVDGRSLSPGAQDFSDDVEAVPVCAPAPPTCGAFGWLERRALANPGIQCEQSVPDPAALIEPKAPTCADIGLPSPGNGGCTTLGCQGVDSGRTGAGMGLLLLLTVLLLRRRRRVGG